MGLLNNNFPGDLLELIRNAAQNRSQSANSGAGSANDLPSWVPRQQQRARPPRPARHLPNKVAGWQAAFSRGLRR